MIKALFIVWIMLLAAYPIAELTRVIILEVFIRGINPSEIPLWQYRLEIALMWTMYLSIVPILKWRLK